MIVIGAKGFAKEIIEAILDSNSDESLVFFDDINPYNPALLFNKYPIISKYTQVEDHFKHIDNRFVLGLAKPRVREMMAEKFRSQGGVLHTVLSRNASYGTFENIIGDGVCVLQKCVIENSNEIGEGSLIHVGSFISHDVQIGKYCEISPYAKLLGQVKIDDYVSIGTGAIIMPKVTIGEGAIIGAGSVVTKNVESNTVVVGIPAKALKK
jgi:sugar O-acyltransferase (sialic acid O-acetyltransferase NeuD family)